MSSKFVHLHVHTHYSLLQALPKVKELVKAAKDLGMDALAITDYGATYGLIDFYQACVKNEIKPILGQCAYLAIDKHTDKRPRIDDKAYQVVLLAENFTGYQNLLRLTTKAHLDGFYYRPRIDRDLLREYGEGLILLVGGTKSDISSALAMDEFGKAEARLREYVEVMGEGNVFLEMQDHPELGETVARNADYRKLSAATGVPLVATKDVHYIKPEDAQAHDILRCIGDGKLVDQENRTRMTDADYSLVSGEHMEQAFADCPEAIENTRRIADRCNVTMELGKWKFPRFEVPQGHTHDSWLREETFRGLRELGVEVTPEVQERVDYELGVIEAKGYAEYFLIVADYCQFARKARIMTTTRGSAAGSLVSYATGIVPVNPLTYNLPFERFLNPFRPSAPDVDCDFEDSRRDEMIAYVTEKYGKDKVAQIGTFGTMAARGSVRDVGRVLGYPYGFVDKISKMIPMGAQGFPMTIRRALDETPELKEEYDNDPEVRRLLNFAQQVEGNARHVSVHAAGVVISPTPMTDYTALQKESGGEKLITQYEMHDVGEDGAGILKMDFLGIRNLSILGNAVKIIKRTKGVDIDLFNIPLDDKKTYDMLARGETIGLFQLNGSGMTKYLMELRPTKVTDIMAMVALYRPGPIEMIPEFIRRKNDPSLITYPEPRLEEILKNTYGIIVYQDDVMMTAIKLANYNWMEADKFRKAMGKKIPEEMARQEKNFREGCAKNGVSEETIENLWNLIKPFAAYGFNKAHACSYGIVAYQTSYLKANWPAEYMAAVLTAESHDSEEVAKVVAECGKMGIEVLPPDVNSSRVSFTYIDDSHIRFGLLAIKGMGQGIARAIIDEREDGGEFRNVADFAARVGSKDFNKKSLEALIKTGAMDSLGERNQLLANIDIILAYHKEVAKGKQTGQVGLFAATDGESRAELTFRAVPEATKAEKLGWERELLGLYVSEHPFREHAKYFEGLITPIRDLETMKITPPDLDRPKDFRPGRRENSGTAVYVGGIIMDSKVVTTKRGEQMAFLRLEDETGSVEVVVFPGAYKENKAATDIDHPVLVQAKLQSRDGERKLLADKINVLDADNAEHFRDLLASDKKKAAAVRGRTLNVDRAEVQVLVPAKMAPSMAQEIKRIFGEHPGTRNVVLVARDESGEKRIKTKFSISLASDVIVKLEALLGRGAVLGD